MNDSKSVDWRFSNKTRNPIHICIQNVHTHDVVYGMKYEVMPKTKTKLKKNSTEENEKHTGKLCENEITRRS